MNKFSLKSKITTFPSMGAWHFLNIPKKESEKINKLFADFKKGFGSIKVKATVGKTSWDTSIFPDTKTNSYLLPVKASVRKKEKIEGSKNINFIIEIKI